MSQYLVLARKWRPQKFSDILGQEHITITLQNALKQNKISHAYLFTGPRGIGKTTTARILAKAINCEQGIKEEPCNNCSSCTEINEDKSLDVIEIDGASNRKIEEIRDLRQNIKFGTAKSKFKIYIIDEVHALTGDAFNALLKTLEEPPPHVKFIFATTEASQIPLTILSRCQRFDFKRISVDLIAKKLKNIADEENIKVDEDSLFVISKFSQGSLRDAESILEQLSIFTDGKISIEKANELLGLVDEEVFFNLINLLIERNITKIWQLINELNYRGKDISKLLKDFIHFLRDMLLIQKGIESSELIDIRPIYREKLKEISKTFNEEQLLSLIDSLSSISYKLKRSESPLMDLEIYILGLLREMDLSTQPLSVGKREEGKKELSVNVGKTNSEEPIKHKQKDDEPKVREPVKKFSSENEIPLPTAENLKNIWSEILKEIKEKSTTLSTLLVNSRIMGFDNDTVKIEVPVTNNYSKTTLDKSKKFIQSKISEKTHRDIMVEFIHTAKEVSKKENIIKTAMKTFDAQIVQNGRIKNG